MACPDCNCPTPDTEEYYDFRIWVYKQPLNILQQNLKNIRGSSHPNAATFLQDRINELRVWQLIGATP